MYLTALTVIIMYKIADISAMSGFKWGALTLAVNLALYQVVPYGIFVPPLSCIIVYIPLLLISIRNGPQ